MPSVTERLGDFSEDGLSDLASVASSSAGSGYLVATTAGKIRAFGDAIHRGDLGAISLDAPVADLAITPDGNGYWLVTTAGTVYAFGTALWRGSLTHLTLQQPVVDLEPHPSGDGYWLTSADGGVFAFGEAEFFGGLADRPLYRPIIDMLSTPDGTGYLLVGADGAIYLAEQLSFADHWLTTNYPAGPSSQPNKHPMARGTGLLAKEKSVYVRFGTLFWPNGGARTCSHRSIRSQRKR